MRQFWIVFLLCLIAVPARGERSVFWEYPEIPVPADDSLGVWDSLYIEENIIIEDLNVYIGIDTGGWAELLAIPVYSPWDAAVYLTNRNLDRRYLNVWFDTEDTEDGPGELEDYNGFNAHGLWTINPTQSIGHYPFVFSSWAIEIYGELETDIAEGTEKPVEFGIRAAYPNPFNSSVAISFGISEPCHTTLEIFNLLGQRVAKIVDDDLQPGVFRVRWDAAAFSSGIYLYRLRSGDRVARGRVTLLK